MLTEISAPQPGLTPAAMLAAAVSMKPLLRERQADTEAANRMLPEVNAGVLELALIGCCNPPSSVGTTSTCRRSPG